MDNADRCDKAVPLYQRAIELSVNKIEERLKVERDTIWQLIVFCVKKKNRFYLVVSSGVIIVNAFSAQNVQGISRTWEGIPHKSRCINVPGVNALALKDYHDKKCSIMEV